MKGPALTIRAGRRKAAHRQAHEMCLWIPSSLAAIDPLCEQIRRLLEARHLEQMQFPVEVLARECLNNAILHGNQGQANPSVSFAMRIGRKLICLRIRDQGPGFNWRRMKRGWPSSSNVNGRGLIVAGIYAQRVAFNRRGNQVTLWINRTQEGR